jgi:GTPase SAR1 family protein
MKKTNLIVIGMAGSGKTTLIQRLVSYLHSIKNAPYVLNLDPAVLKVPYGANIDIRDTVDYKGVMKSYGLGPNGAILTSLNLFTTKFDQVLDLIEKKDQEYILWDTPGQIEIFTWSASGAIITEALASAHPTVLVYVLDTPRSSSPITFMSNMLYACSILYKTKLPFLVVFNKTDVVGCDFALEWMKDFEVFQEALAQETSYMGTFMNSMVLLLEEFYSLLEVVGVSAVTGAGMEEFFQKIDEAAERYESDYKPWLLECIKEKNHTKEAEKRESLAKILKDLNLDHSSIS